MDVDLLTITAEELLEKFGAGNHKPGSGSAAAFHGMISAKLLVTVISLTNEKKRRDKYESNLSYLLKMSKRIENHIFPELVTLFKEDSVHFGNTITLRKSRDKENNVVKKSHLKTKALEELKTSIQLPIRIANLCIELSEIGEFVFDNAFKSARGDSQVAFSGAVAALAGCISIIQLNLLSFGNDEYDWTNEIVAACNILSIKHEELNNQANERIKILGKEVGAKRALFKDINDLLKGIREQDNLSDSQIERSAISLQRLLWKNRDIIWSEELSGNPIEILKPSTIFKKVLGYLFDESAELKFVHDAAGFFETAGVIDQQNRFVQIYSHLPNHIKNFTAAHELGHAMLHKQTLMHRDIPLDGSTSNRSRNKEELQADKFATYFLMPAKQVEQLFVKIFSTNKFRINENSTFNLTKGDITSLKAECKDLRSLSRKLASAVFYGNEYFISMADSFNVSIEAMAIRLEELGLLEY